MAEFNISNNGGSMKNIFSALVKAQKNFAPALKTSTNPHFKSKYADLAACVEAVIDALNSSGIALIQQCSESSDGVIVETVFIHESGEMYQCGKLHVPASKHDAQGYGSALTYARRYSLMAACGIAPEDDDGNNAVKKPTAKPFDLAKYSSEMRKAKDDGELKQAYLAAKKAAIESGDTGSIEELDKIGKEVKKSLSQDQS
jgi:hypothetical protein